jgi:hypothetical protein
MYQVATGTVIRRTSNGLRTDLLDLQRRRKDEVSRWPNQPAKRRSRTSISYVPWGELNRRTLGIHPLECPVCHATTVLHAVIIRQEVVRRIHEHLKVPSESVVKDDGPGLHVELTGEDVPFGLLAWIRTRTNAGRLSTTLERQQAPGGVAERALG